nr:Uncharacterised protein [Klebsiella pneumoniae]
MTASAVGFGGQLMVLTRPDAGLLSLPVAGKR